MTLSPVCVCVCARGMRVRGVSCPTLFTLFFILFLQSNWGNSLLSVNFLEVSLI